MTREERNSPGCQLAGWNSKMSKRLNDRDTDAASAPNPSLRAVVSLK
jgi:hypothetical protein